MVDSSLHGEKALVNEKAEKQYEKSRKKETAGAKRAKEYFLDKLTSALKMVNRAIKEGMKAKYVIFDNWYASSFAFINSLLSKGLIVVCAMKNNIVIFIYLWRLRIPCAFAAPYKKRDKRSFYGGTRGIRASGRHSAYAAVTCRSDPTVKGCPLKVREEYIKTLTS